MCRRMVLLIGVVLLLVGLTGRAQGFEVLLKVDIGRENQRVEAGFVDVNESEEYGMEPWVLADVGGSAIGLTLETTYPGNMLAFRNVPGAPGTHFDPLFEDLVCVNDWFGYGVVLTLDGLSAGTYSVESYHNNIWESAAPVSNIDILVNGQLIVEDAQQSRTRTGLFGSSVLFVFEVSADQNSAEIRFLPTGEPADCWDNATLNGFILYSGEVPQMRASEPSPDNQSLRICPDGVELEWKPGAYADVHDLYFGTSLSDVNESASPEETSYGPNSWPAPSNLEPGTTYYWRIDEVNGPNTWVGYIWWFETQTGQAFDPHPEDDERGRAAGEVELSWTASCRAGSHNVYFGTDFNDVNEATTLSPEYKDNVSDTNYAVTTESFTRYYWRIDEVGAETIHGEVWQFRTGVGGLLMWYDFDGSLGSSVPSPITDSTGNVTFSKHVGSEEPGSLEYGVPNPVYNNSGTSADFEAQACLHRRDPCLPREVDILRLDGYEYTIEMWVRMEAEPEADYVLIEKDDVWGIRINENRIVEYWHAGDDVRWNLILVKGYPLQVGQWYHIAAVFDFTALPRHRLYLDGGLVATRDACISNIGAPQLNPADSNVPVGIGARARVNPTSTGSYFMNYFEGKIDELRVQDVALTMSELLTVPGPEWANDPSPYNGEKGIEPNDPNLVLSWLPGISAASHDVYLGTGYEEVEAAGTVDAEYVDRVDVNEYADTNSLGMEYGKTYYWRIDEVNGMDLWKGVVWHFTTRYEIVDPNLRVWYKLDEHEGTMAVDHSGHELHGDLDDEANWDPNGGQYDGCLIFDDDTAVLPPYNVLDGIGSAISVSVWLNGMKQGSPRDNWLADAGGGYHHLQVKVPDANGNVYWRAGNATDDVLVWKGGNPASWVGFWHHLAFIKDETAGEMRIYFDGKVVDSNSVVADTLSNLANRTFKIGAKLGHGSDYEGRVDDFRIYDRALTPLEVELLFRGGDLARAWGPSPFHGEEEVLRDVALTWRPGNYAVSHDVYFGTALDDVNDANTNSSVFVDNREPNEYDPPGYLELGKSYYWRIDEVNDSNVDSPWKGHVWSFTAANFLIVDDMETYNKTNNRIYNTWEDGYGNGSGSELGLGIAPLKPVHGGKQSMEYLYDNADSKGWELDYYSEISVDVLHANLKIQSRDWTQGGVKILTLFFYGDPGNDATEQMYVGLEDTRGAGSYAQVNYGYYGEDMNDIKDDEWQQWDIAMSDFTDVDANNAGTLYIGFGIRGNPYGGTPGGSGTVYFDNIRLYRPKCVPWRLKPAADFTDDCIVNLADVSEMAEQWLRRDVNVAPVTPPSDANKVGHWTFEEGTGSTVGDTSGNNYHGTAEGDCAWVAGKVGSYAMDFDGGWVVVEDEGNTPKLRMKHYVSVIAWIYLDGPAGSDDRVVIKGEDDEETFGLEVGDDKGLAFLFRDSNNPDDVMSVTCGYALAPYEWIHVAGTYDQNEQTCYVGGVAENSETRGPIELFTDPNDGMGIAGRYGDSGTGGRFDGAIDDVRVYDRALTRAEIAWLASDSSGMILLTSEANLFDGEDPEVINFRDLDVLLDKWLDEKLWPPE